MNFSLLSQPFPAEDIEWRIGRSGKNTKGIWATCLAYVTNRAIMNRLDEVCGPQNWKNEFQAGPSGGILCGISINVGGEWVTKWDGAENTNIEAVKGGLSDAMKRAAVQWGIGRYLYNLEEGFATVSAEKKPNYRYAQTKEKDSYYWFPPALPPWALPLEKPSVNLVAGKIKEASTKERKDELYTASKKYSWTEDEQKIIDLAYES